MMLRLIFPACALLAALSTGCASLYDVHVGGASVSYWSPELSGDISRDFGPALGDQVDLERTLNFDDEKILEFRGFVSAGPVTIEATYFGLEFDGTNTISESFTFDGETFNIGATLDSKFEFQYAAAKAKIGLIGAGPIAIGGIIGVGYFGLEGEVTEPAISGESFGDSLDTPFPFIGATATLDQPLGDTLSVFAEGEIYGLAIDDRFDLDGHFFDAQARAGLGFGPAKIGVGYRLMEIDLEETHDDNAEYNLSLTGPYIFGEIAF
ncbi:MAG: hypothetical protein AAF488_08925 [Planctomycetota bacterium]